MGMLLSYHEGYRPESDPEPAPRKRQRKPRAPEGAKPAEKPVGDSDE